jgi:hypothetical protein
MTRKAINGWLGSAWFGVDEARSWMAGGEHGEADHEPTAGSESRA